MRNTKRRNLSRLAAALITGALTLTLPGCSDDEGCDGQSYRPDLGQEGAESPIAALSQWLGSPDGLPDPPTDADWTVQDTGEEDPSTVVITHHDGDGWWVSTVRTEGGGWVVSAATDDAADCADELE